MKELKTVKKEYQRPTIRFESLHNGLLMTSGEGMGKRDSYEATDDNKFVDCAVTAGATYIVSNDRHFRELERYDFPKVDVRTLAQFLDIVRTL